MTGELYDIILRQQYIKVAEVGFGWLLFILFIVFPFLCLICRTIRGGVFDSRWEDVVLAGIVVMIFLSVLLFFTLDTNAIGILINPNYYVIQEVVKLLQTGR